MPRKCCAIYDGISCRSNYNNTKTFKVKKLQSMDFQDSEEQQKWRKSLPLQFGVTTVSIFGETKNM